MEIPNQRHNRAGVKKTWNTLVKFIEFNPDVLFDMGVGHTQTEAWLFNDAYPNAKIIGLEPSKIRRDYIQKHYPGVLLDKAIYKKTGVFQGKFGKFEYGDFKFNTELDNYELSTLETITLDDLDKKFGPFSNSVVWADIEGSEMDMLKGAIHLLTEKRIGCLVLEVWKDDGISEFLKKYNYQISGKSKKDYIFLRSE